MPEVQFRGRWRGREERKKKEDCSQHYTSNVLYKPDVWPVTLIFPPKIRPVKINLFIAVVNASTIWWWCGTETTDTICIWSKSTSRHPPDWNVHTHQDQCLLTTSHRGRIVSSSLWLTLWSRNMKHFQEGQQTGMINTSEYCRGSFEFNSTQTSKF